VHFALEALRYDLVISGLAVADTLSASFLATMVCVAPTRDLFAACYPREPLLAEIAAHVCSNEDRFCRSLYTAGFFYRSGHVLHKGDAGELAAMAALLGAQKRAVMKLRVNEGRFLTDPEHEHSALNFVFSHSIPLLELFEALLPQGAKSTISLELENCSVCFNRFVQMQRG